MSAVKEERFVSEENRARWGRGPWDGEPDRVEFEHAGFPCLIIRQERAGHLCGYVAVPPGHPAHGQGYDDVRVMEDAEGEGEYPEVHGGLTYAGACEGRVCHVPAPGEPDDVWWFGFDCAHGGDLRPGDAPGSELSRFYESNGLGRPPFGDEYRTVEYVRGYCERFAEQLARMGGAK